MNRDVIIALDFPSKDEALSFLDKFQGTSVYVKIGMELFYSEGPDIIKEIKKRGYKIFLDLKLHDIPNTVESAMRIIAGLDVDMTNLHCAGTKKMMEAGIKGLKEGASEGKIPMLIGVTMLTSTSQERMEKEILINKSIEDVVVSYANQAKEAGLAGVVCSPLEAEKIHNEVGDNFVTVTPGIRFADDSKGDQVRVTTPERAKKLGSDYIVVGRSITGAADPVAAYKKCLKEFL